MRAKYLYFLVFGLLFFQQVTGQQMSKDKSGGIPDPQISQKDNDYLDRQAKVFLDTIQSILAKYPPVIHDGRERTTAKLLMDAVFHEKFAAFRLPPQQFFHSQ